MLPWTSESFRTILGLKILSIQAETKHLFSNVIFFCCHQRFLWLISVKSLLF